MLVTMVDQTKDDTTHGMQQGNVMTILLGMFETRYAPMLFWIHALRLSFAMVKCMAQSFLYA